MARLFGLHAQRARWRLAVVLGGLIAGGFAGVLLWHWGHRPVSACEQEVRTGDPGAAVETCLRMYRETGDEHDLLWAAKAYLRAGDAEHAGQLAYQLLAGKLQGDAHNLLSYLALRKGRGREAQLHAILASTAHMATGDLHGLASDAVLLSQADWRTGDFEAALSAAELGLRLAVQLGDFHTEFLGYIARADALRRIGDLPGAGATLATASRRAVEPCDRTWARLKNALYLSDAKKEDMALLWLTEAEKANRTCKSRDVASMIAANRAWLLRKRDPAAALAQLDELAKSDDETADTLLLRGDLAADRGALDEAVQYLAQAERAEPPHADWPWEIACDRGELSELRGGVLGELIAEYDYRRSTAMVAGLRATAHARSAFLVSSHRRPYDGLISLLAGSGRWRDALAVVLDLDASDMLRATAVEGIDRDRLPPADDAPAPSAAVATPPDIDTVLSAWRSRDLVIILARAQRQIGSGSERVYRLQISHGQVTGEDVGDANEARRWAVELFENPGDRRAARALGKMLVPAGATDQTLHVLAVGPLGKVPLAALRDDDGSPIIRRRPLVRVLSLRAARPESTGDGPSVVIADPRDNLPGAAEEGDLVARALGPGVKLSGSHGARRATRSELWAARGARLLHVAGHVVAHGRWRVLPLADGEVEPAEMLQHGLAPRIAVVASCGSAAAMDEEGWGSIASALLDAGTAVVVATDRPVEDSATLAMMRDFYAQPDWSTDPARALARVQQARDAAAPDAPDAPWAAFSVLGRPPYVP